MAILSLNIAVVALCLASLCSYLVSTCNVHSGLHFYGCTKYSKVSYSQPYKCGFWYWQRCYRRKYTHSAHHSTCVRSCRVNGGWNSWQAWGGWSTCDRACGNGRRFRYGVRECNNPAPKNGGSRCPGSHIRKQSESCLLKHCPVNGAWSSWQTWAVWSPCDKTCGNGKRLRQRARVCNNPSPKYGGLQCRGSRIKKEFGTCLQKYCPVDGRWSEFGPWSKFSECARTCGGGGKTRYRYRKCNNPKPKHGGRLCPGNSIFSETAPCNTKWCEDFAIAKLNQTADTGNNFENTTDDTPPEINNFENSTVDGSYSTEDLPIQFTTKPLNDFIINGTASTNLSSEITTTPSSTMTTPKNET